MVVQEWMEHECTFFSFGKLRRHEDAVLEEMILWQSFDI